MHAIRLSSVLTTEDTSVYTDDKTTWKYSKSHKYYGFPTQLMLPMLMYDSEPHRLPTTAAAAHPNKTAPFLWACGTDERLPRHFQSPTYVDSRAAQGLETPHLLVRVVLKQDPHKSTSHECNSYSHRTCIIVNGCHWNMRKFMFIVRLRLGVWTHLEYWC